MKYANQSVSFIQLQKKSDEIIQKRKKEYIHIENKIKYLNFYIQEKI